MDLLWNTLIKRPLSEDQKSHLKQLIDLLNSLDDHKLSPMREMIQAMSPMLTPLMVPYPSLGHTCTLIFTNTIPAYQKYLTSLESQVKDSHTFTREEILLYYEMTLVDHLIISHVFEQESNLNLIEVIETIKTVIIMNAITHDYLQDTLGRSISMFTFLQRGGVSKDATFTLYQELTSSLQTTAKENITNTDCLAYIEFMSMTLSTLAKNAATPSQPAASEPMPVLQEQTGLPQSTAQQPVITQPPVTATVPESTQQPSTPPLVQPVDSVETTQTPALNSAGDIVASLQQPQQ
jgi:hypothetical protein